MEIQLVQHIIKKSGEWLLKNLAGVKTKGVIYQMCIGTDGCVRAQIGVYEHSHTSVELINLYLYLGMCVNISTTLIMLTHLTHW